MTNNKTDRKSDWRNEFEDKFGYYFENETNQMELSKHGILDFISNLLSKQREQLVEEMHAVLNYELTENFDGMGWNNDGWKDELLEAINSAINKLNKLGDEKEK